MNEQFDHSSLRSVEPDFTTINVLKTEILNRKRAAELPKKTDFTVPLISSKRFRFFPKFAQVSIDKKSECSMEPYEAETYNHSYQCLLKKSVMYDKLTNGEIPPLADEDNPFLVDFEKKYYDKKLDSKYVNMKVFVEDGKTFVEFVDNLGRTRRCRREELEYLDSLSAPKIDLNAYSVPTTFVNDAYRDMLRNKWQEELKKTNNIPDVHYQNVKFDEIRNLGVGYFEFSTDESMRKEQMQLLNEMRVNTVKEHMKVVYVEARKAEKNRERLNRICRNRGISLSSDELSNELEISECLEEIIWGVEKVSFADAATRSTQDLVASKNIEFDYIFKKPSDEEHTDYRRIERNLEYAPQS